MTNELRQDIIGYAATDMLCYRSPDAELAAEQTRLWDPLLMWAQVRYGINMQLTDGIMPIVQPETSVMRLAEEVQALPDDTITGYAILTKHLGSLIAVLALKEGHISLNEALTIGFLEEEWQAAKWGEEEEAKEKRAAKKAECTQAAKALG